MVPHLNRNEGDVHDWRRIPCVNTDEQDKHKMRKNMNINPFMITVRVNLHLKRFNPTFVVWVMLNLICETIHTHHNHHDTYILYNISVKIHKLSYMDCHGLEVLSSLGHDVPKPENRAVWSRLMVKHALRQVGAVYMRQDVPSALKKKEKNTQTENTNLICAKDQIMVLRTHLLKLNLGYRMLFFISTVKFSASASIGGL